MQMGETSSSSPQLLKEIKGEPGFNVNKFKLAHNLAKLDDELYYHASQF